jgi:hypothetical protein
MKGVQGRSQGNWMDDGAQRSKNGAVWKRCSEDVKNQPDKRIRYIHIVPQLSGDVSPRHNNIARLKARAAPVVEAIIPSALVV